MLGVAGHERAAQAEACRCDAEREAVAAALSRGGAVQHALLLAAQRPHLTGSRHGAGNYSSVGHCRELQRPVAHLHYSRGTQAAGERHQ